jgi:hypothetical protein
VEEVEKPQACRVVQFAGRYSSRKKPSDESDFIEVVG